MKKTIFNFIVVIIIIISAIITITTLSSKENGVAEFAGYIPLSIQTKSMQGTINEGDLIITKKYENQTLKKDDIISFFATVQDQTVIKTHRIIEVKKNDDETSYVTKGDNNKYADSKEVKSDEIVGIYTNTKLNGVGSILDFFKSKYGFLACIILPIFIIFIYQLKSFIKLLKKEGKTDE